MRLWTPENTRIKSRIFICPACGERVQDVAIGAPKKSTDKKKICTYRYCPYCGEAMDGTEEAETIQQIAALTMRAKEERNAVQ